MKEKDTDLLKILGKRLQTLRQNQRLSITDFANKTGISRSALQNYEAGNRQPSLATIRHLADALGCSAAWLATFSENAKEGDEYSYHLANPSSPDKKQSLSDYATYSVYHLRKHGALSADIKVIRCGDNFISPDIIKDDDVIVDTGRKIVDGVNIYCIKNADGKYIFRWARKELKGGFTIYSNNDTHFPPVFIEDDSEKVEIVGLVVGLTRLR